MTMCPKLLNTGLAILVTMIGFAQALPRDNLQAGRSMAAVITPEAWPEACEGEDSAVSAWGSASGCPMFTVPCSSWGRECS